MHYCLIDAACVGRSTDGLSWRLDLQYDAKLAVFSMYVMTGMS